MASNNSKKLFGNRGFSLIELSIATGIVMISLVAAGNIVNLLYSSNSHLDSLSKQNIVKGNIVGQLVTESNWKATFSDKTNQQNNKMDCLYNHTDCSGVIAPQTFRLLDSKLNVLYNGAATDGTTPNGYTATGATCANFGAPNDACPYHYDLTWQPVCNAGACIDPLVKIHGNFNVNFASQVAGRPNSKNYLPMNFDVVMNMKPRANLYAYPITFYVNWNQNPGPVYAPFTFSIPHSPIANAEGAITLLSATKGDPGAAVVQTGNTIRYTPKPNFYGIDFVEYKFQDEIGNQGTGRVWMKVVTPFTWVGDGSDKKASSKANWCGTVSSDGQCMHDMDPTVGFPHLVFNNNCNVCSQIELDIPRMDGLEIMSSFHGTISQTTDVLIETQPAGWGLMTPLNASYHHQGFYQSGGTFDTNGFNLTNQTDYPITNQAGHVWHPGSPAPGVQNDSGMVWDGTGEQPVQSNFYLAAGKFIISANKNVTAYNSGMQIASGVDFENNGSLTIEHYWMRLPYFATGSGINVGNLNAVSVGSGGPSYIGSNLTVKDLNLDGGGTAENGICGAAPSQVLVTGNITSVNIGGISYCGGPPYSNQQSIVLSDSAPHTVTGSADPLDPGVVPNLVTSAVQPTTFSGNLIFDGDTNLQGTTTFAVNSRVNLVQGTLSATSMPVFYDSGFMGGDNYVLNTPITVSHDFTIDRCLGRLNDGDGCSGYRIGAVSSTVDIIYLKGDLHLKSGVMDLGGNTIATIKFDGTNDQNIFGESATGMVSMPAILVDKPSGKFSMLQVTPGGSMNFMGPFEIKRADSVPQFTGTNYYFGNGQMYTYNWLKFTSFVPLDFGSADLKVIGSAWDLKGQTLLAGSLSKQYGFGTAAGPIPLLQISGDVNTPTYGGGNANLEFVGGHTHQYTTYVYNSGPWSPLVVAHDMLVDNGETVVLNSFTADITNMRFSGGTLDQHSQQLKNCNVTGPTGTWISGGGSTPINFTNGSYATFGGTIQ